MDYNQAEVSALLFKYQKALDITREQYLWLNAFLLRSNIDSEKVDFDEIKEMTDLDDIEVRQIYNDLLTKGFYTEKAELIIDTKELTNKIKKRAFDSMNLKEKLSFSLDNYNYEYLLNIRSHPKGIYILNRQGRVILKSEMLELAQGLIDFIGNADEADLKQIENKKRK